MRYLLLLLFYSCSCLAASQNIAELKGYAILHIQKHLGNLSGRIEISINDIDSRIKLNKCDQPIKYELANNNKISSKMYLYARCESNLGWKVPLTANVKQFQKVYLSSKAITKGNIIKENDIVMQEKDTFKLLDYTKNKKELIGKVAKSSIAAGQVLSSKNTLAKIIVKRGDIIEILSTKKNIAVNTTGIAQEDGYLNKSIKVKNKNSGRIVQGQIIAAGKVEV